MSKRFLTEPVCLLMLVLCQVISQHHVQSCHVDDDCPVMGMECSSHGSCQCRDSHVAWKWSCYPRVEIGQGCVASVQCKSQVWQSGKIILLTMLCKGTSYCCVQPSQPSVQQGHWPWPGGGGGWEDEDAIGIV